MKPILLVSTSDAEQSRRFYAEIPGLKFVEDQPHALVFDSGGYQLRVQKVEKVLAQPYTAAGWEVEDIDTLVTDLAAKGVAMKLYPFLEQDELGIWTTPDGVRISWCEDPDGNVLSFTQFPPISNGG